MQTARHQGLAGKARRRRDFGRAHRLHTQQLIEEYLESDGELSRPERFIPVRTRGEFFPTAAPALTDDEAGENAQLELRLPGDTRDPVESTPLQKLAEVVERSSAEDAPAEPTTRVQPNVIRPVRRGFEPTYRRRPPHPAIPKGFLVGCALGSAVAAVLLVAVRLVVG